jgi:hypothetical protein
MHNFHHTDPDIAIFEESTLGKQETIENIVSPLQDKEQEPPEDHKALITNTFFFLKK